VEILVEAGSENRNLPRSTVDYRSLTDNLNVFGLNARTELSYRI